MTYLLAATIVAALIVGYSSNAKIFVTATIGVLVTSLLLLAQDNGGFAYAGKVVLDVAVFEVTAICVMMYFSAGQSRAPKPRRKAQL